MILGLAICAIVLAGLALIPYALETYLYFRHKPRFDIKVTSVQKRSPSDDDKAILEFELLLSLQESSKPIVLKRVSLGFPRDKAEPVVHSQYEGAPEGMRYGVQDMMTPQLVASPTESGLRLILHEGELALIPPKLGTLAMYPLAFRVEADLDVLNLDATMRSEIDRTVLGFWSIFYHTSVYVTHKSIPVITPT
jgi:hypothetical protein